MKCNKRQKSTNRLTTPRR